MDKASSAAPSTMAILMPTKTTQPVYMEAPSAQPSSSPSQSTGHIVATVWRAIARCAVEAIHASAAAMSARPVGFKARRTILKGAARRLGYILGYAGPTRVPPGRHTRPEEVRRSPRAGNKKVLNQRRS